MFVSAPNASSSKHQPLHRHSIKAAAASAAAVLASNDTSASSTEDDQHHFELSQYTPFGVEHFSAAYRNDRKALEKLSRRINHRVEQDSSDLINFCDKRIRKRRKQHQKQQQKMKEGEDRSQHDAAYAVKVGPEIVQASDLMLGKCLGQGSFSSVFVLEKHLHRPPSVSSAPRRGRRSRLSTGTNQGSTSHRGSSIRLDTCNSTNQSRSNHSTSRHGMSESQSGRSQRRRVRQDSKSGDEGNEGSNRSLDNSSSQRSRSLSPGRGSSHKKNNGSSRSRSLSRSLRDGIRACFRKKTLNQQKSEDEDDEENFYRKKVKRRSSNESIFRGGSRSLSCRRRRSQTRRSRSQDNSAHTSKTFNTDLDDNNSSHSHDTAYANYPQRGVLWKKDFPDENIDEIYGGANSNLVVKILQPKLMDQPKLFANCAAGLIREGLFLASIDHPHVLKVHAWTSPDAWMDFATLSSREGDLYDGYILVLERLKGGSLKGWMNRWQLGHREEQRALAAAAVAAMETEHREKQRSQRRFRLSLTSESDESPTFDPSTNPSLMASKRKYRRSLDSEFAAAAAAATASVAIQDEPPKSPGHSPKAAFDAAYLNQHNDRVYPYTTQWPKTQLADRASILLQLSDTVKYLHKHRILHRDLKPDNLGVTFVDNLTGGGKKKYASTLSLKIFDFDIARLVPEEPKMKRISSAQSFDQGMFNDQNSKQSERAGRSLSPFRASNSLTGDNQVRRRTKGKYRGQRPRRQAEASGEAETPIKAESTVPTEVNISAETPVDYEPDTKRDALFDMTAKMGSPRYMAPEIARGEPYNLRSEVYTVSLLVHEVLTLQKPYDELQPEDHARLVHFDLPGYRPPIFADWQWPSELEEMLHLAWGDINERPSMKEVHSVLKRALPKLCPEVGKQPKKQESSSTLSQEPLQKAEEKPSTKKGQGIFHRTPKKNSKHHRRSMQSESLTPTASASNSDFSLSDDNDEIVGTVE